MSNIVVENKQIVIPGQVLAKGMDYLPGDNTYREGDTLYAKTLGLANLKGRVLKVTPLAGPYQPKVGDKVLCQVTDILMSGWRVGFGTAYSAVLSVKNASSRFIKNDEDLSNILAIGDYALMQITKVTSQNLIDVTMKDHGLGKLEGGRVIRVNSFKVPRVIGKNASMISLVTGKTNCQVSIGQNGYVWIKGQNPEDELKAELAIKMIQAKSHESGLTEKMEKFLSGGAQ